MDIPEGWIAASLIGGFIIAIFVLNAVEFGRVD